LNPWVGNPVKASADVPRVFASTDLSPGVELIAGLEVISVCGKRRPRRFVAEARP
jgi:hypothetical protein